jgi:hypothetical protein
MTGAAAIITPDAATLPAPKQAACRARKINLGTLQGGKTPNAFENYFQDNHKKS